MEPIGGPETSVLKHVTPRNNPEDGRIHIYSYPGQIRARSYTKLAVGRRAQYPPKVVK